MTSIVELLQAAGIVAYPLAAFSVLSVALVAERCLFWWRVKRRQRLVVRQALLLYPSNTEAALAHLEKNLDLPIARIFLEALTLDRSTPEKFRLALESAAQAEIPLLKRFSTLFDTIITLSPLLGLLGTVLGLMRSFSSLQLGNIGTTQADTVTSGISEALVSTAFGLIVAVFTLFFANTFRGFYLRQLALMQEYGGQLELLHISKLEQTERSSLGIATEELSPYGKV